jgi:purine-binding chemotaxis protein CheW
MANDLMERPAQAAGTVSTPGEGLGSDVSQYVMFVAGAEVFAVDLTPVQEIIRVPEVVRVPLAPKTLDGLANLRGKVLPIVSLRRIFGFAEQPPTDATRALVIDLGQPLGFVVDRVLSVVGVEASKVEGVGAIQRTVNTELLSGIIKDVGGHPMIMVLDFPKLIAQEFAAITAATGRAAHAAGVAEAREDAAPAEVLDELQLVSFDVAGQEYAIAIEDVKEIVQVPEQVVHVPHADAHVLGVMTLRNRLLPLVSLRRMFGLPPQDADEQSRIVVVALGTASVGIVMDRVNEVLRVARADVEAMPGLFAREGGVHEIAGICRLEGGKRLVSIIGATDLFRHSAIREALTTMERESGTDDRTLAATGQPLGDEEQVVVFRLGKEEFGVPIDSVQEIVRVPEELTHVPRAPAFVEGVINLRGAVLPVIDLRRRLGLDSLERSDRQRIMVFLIDGLRTGFIVDSVAEVLKIPKAAIEPAPRLSTDQGKLLARMANLEQQKRLVQLIAPEHLMDRREIADLAGMGG